MPRETQIVLVHNIDRFLPENLKLADLPVGATIWNAPRPLYASPDANGKNMEGRGDFLSGIFYAVTDPADEYVAMWEKNNWQQDACILRPVSDEELDAMLEKHLSWASEKYGAERIKKALGEGETFRRKLIESLQNNVNDVMDIDARLIV